MRHPSPMLLRLRAERRAQHRARVLRALGRLFWVSSALFVAVHLYIFFVR